MTRTAHISVAKNLPEFIREEYPLFVKLVEEYYKFLDTRVTNIDSIKDVDNTPEVFIEYFRKQFSINISSFWNLDFKEFLYFAKGFYSARGSDQSVRFLFRAMFGEEINIEYPDQYTLRASDGRWFQEYHIEIKQLAGSTPVLDRPFKFENQHGVFEIYASRIVQIPNSARCIVYFEQRITLKIINEQILRQYDDTGVSYAGRVVLTSSKLQIDKPGKYWQKGSVIRIPGTYADTIARITDIGESGSIKKLEVIEYGYDHDASQSIIVTPFANRPINSDIEINSVLISSSPLRYAHSLSIRDYTEGCEEAILGVDSNQDYFIDQYFDSGFHGRTAIAIGKLKPHGQAANIVLDKDYFSEDFYNEHPAFFYRTLADVVEEEYVPDNTIAPEDTTTLEKWLESRATITISKDLIVRDRGYYTSAESLINNQDVRMSDNFMYQQFSYVLETERDLREYRDSIGLTHPAGMKFFSLLTKEVRFEIDVDLQVAIGTDMINVFDIIIALDYRNKDIGKNSKDRQVVTDGEEIYFGENFFGEDFFSGINMWNEVVKARRDSVEAVDSESIYFESDFFGEVFYKTVPMVKIIGKHKSDTVVVSEVFKITPTKYFGDRLTLVDADYEKPFYVGDMFAETYFESLLNNRINKDIYKNFADEVQLDEQIWFQTPYGRLWVKSINDSVKPRDNYHRYFDGDFFAGNYFASASMSKSVNAHLPEDNIDAESFIELQQQNSGKALIDSTSLTEEIKILRGKIKLFTDSVIPKDGKVKLKSDKRLVDSVNMTDSIAFNMKSDHKLNLGDSVNLNESIAKLTTIYDTDSVGVSDTTKLLRNRVRTLTDSVSTIDTTDGFDVVKLISDSTDTSEVFTFAKKTNHKRQFADSVNLIENQDKHLVKLKKHNAPAIDDVVQVTVNDATYMGLVDVTDELAFVEVKAKRLVKNISDTVTFEEEFFKSLHIVHDITDNAVTVTDAINTSVMKNLRDDYSVVENIELDIELFVDANYVEDGYLLNKTRRI